MLRLKVPSLEFWDSKKEEFYKTKEVELQLEHSLVSISKWEQKFHKSFLDTKDKSDEEMIFYIKCMTITQNIDDIIFSSLPREIINQIADYINDPMTATTFSDPRKSPKKDIITSEIIYYWMIAYNIPFECQKWHLNRLLTLIKVCDIKNNSDNKKMSRNEIMSRNRTLNEARKAKYNTRG